MNRLIFFSALVACLCISKTARADSPVPTTQPASAQRNQNEPMLIITKPSRVSSSVTMTIRNMNGVSLPTPWRQQWPPLVRSITPMQNPPAGWVLKNSNSNTWHYVIPMSSEW